MSEFNLEKYVLYVHFSHSYMKKLLKSEVMFSCKLKCVCFYLANEWKNLLIEYMEKIIFLKTDGP